MNLLKETLLLLYFHQITHRKINHSTKHIDIYPKAETKRIRFTANTPYIPKALLKRRQTLNMQHYATLRFRTRYIKVPLVRYSDIVNQNCQKGKSRTRNSEWVKWLNCLLSWGRKSQQCGDHSENNIEVNAE